MLSKLSSEECWAAFSEYKTSLTVRKAREAQLERVIEEKSYIPVSEAIAEGRPFPLPRRAVISKQASQKKRVVYIYPEPENTVLKLLTYLLLRKYDGLFSGGLYSFRPGVSAHDAVKRLRRIPGIDSMWSYKLDISNYFNSVPVERFLPLLEETLADDPELYSFLERLLKEKRVVESRAELVQDGAEVSDEVPDGAEVAARLNRAEGQTGHVIVEEQKGIMAGTPLSAFYANLYLKDMDWHFEQAGVPCARYSDDIIVFAPTEEEIRARAEELKGFLAEKGLTVNPKKEQLSSPDEGWTFLGFRYREGVTDIAPATVDKIKGKMRRKARALVRWSEQGGHSREKAAAAFIRIFNKKLLGISSRKAEDDQGGQKAINGRISILPDDNQLTWSLWFFPVINTVESLQLIDSYAQDCLRFILSGTRTKARYNVRYEELKALGYRSLVNEYYRDQEKIKAQL